MRRIRRSWLLVAVGAAAVLVAAGCAPGVLKTSGATLPGGVRLHFFGAAPQVSVPAPSPFTEQQPVAAPSATDVGQTEAPVPPATTGTTRVSLDSAAPSKTTSQMTSPERARALTTETVGHHCPFSGG